MQQTKVPIEKAKARGRSEEKRQQIVQAASLLFAQQGYLGTSMDQVAEAASVSKQTVYSHFGAKEELFRLCIEDRCIANAMNEQVFAGSQSMKEALTHFAQHFQELIMSQDAIHLTRLCTASAEQHPEISEMFFSAGPAQVEQALHSYLTRQRDAGKFHCDDLDLACDQLLCLLKGANHFTALLGLPSQHSPDRMQAYIDSCVDMFLSYYR